MHISENRLEGSLLDTSLQEVLDECHAHLVTATLAIEAGAEKAVLEIRAGAVDSVEFKGLKKTEALASLHALKDGEFALVQRLPDLSGELGDGASLETESEAISLVKVMQHCENNALSCTVTITSGDDTAEIIYKVGDIDAVKWNGKRDDDKIVDAVNLEGAKIRVEAPPLKLGILSWPTVRDDPTPAFIPIKEMAEGRLDAKVKPVAPASAAKKVAAKKATTAKKATAVTATAAKKATATEPASRPMATAESGGAAVLIGLFVGLIVLAAVLVFAIKALTAG